jgi:hypothetical protein
MGGVVGVFGIGATFSCMMEIPAMGIVFDDRKHIPNEGWCWDFNWLP